MKQGRQKRRTREKIPNLYFSKMKKKNRKILSLAS